MRHARFHPEEPWLFRAEGWDWRWHPWKEIAARVARWAEPLAALPAGTRVAFLYSPRPAAIVLDLAIQAAGLTSLPMSLDTDLPEGRCVQAAPEGEPLVDLGGVEAIPLPAWGDGAPEAPLSLLGRGRPAGGVLVRGAGGWEERSQDDLRTAAERLEREVQQAGPPWEGREVLVTCRPLAEPAERALLAWATHVRAALLLEPAPTSCVATTAWARPTVFHGTLEETAALRRFEEGSVPRLWKRRHRLPFGRLRLILVRGDGELAAEDVAFWEGRGVRVALTPVPSPATPTHPPRERGAAARPSYTNDEVQFPPSPGEGARGGGRGGPGG